MYLIVLRPVLPEDEGRHTIVLHATTRKQAEKWIKDQEGEYHPPEDYYVCKQENW